VVAFNPPPITGMSTTGGFEAYLQNRSGAPPQAIMETAQALATAADERPELADVQATLNTDISRYHADLDREKAMALNVPINEVFATMQATFGALDVNDFTLLGRNFQVNIQSEPSFRDQPDDLDSVYVRSSDGRMIPLSSLVMVTRARDPTSSSVSTCSPRARSSAIRRPAIVPARQSRPWRRSRQTRWATVINSRGRALPIRSKQLVERRKSRLSSA